MSEWEVAKAFHYLRPITVMVTQNHDVESIQALSNVLKDDSLTEEVVQHMYEYIAFPLRLVLKNYAFKDGSVCIATLECLNLLLNRIKLESKAICLDLFKTVLDLIFLPSKRSTAVDEGIKIAAIATFTALFSRSGVSCYKYILKEALPLYGGLVSTLLTTASAGQPRELPQASLDCLFVLVDDRHDAELRRILFTVLPSFLPGVIKHITKIVTGHAPKAKVTAISLKVMYEYMRITLSDTPWEKTEEMVALPRSYFTVDTNVFAIVVKTEEWNKMATQSLSLVVKNIADVCMSHSSWLVRKESINWSYHILLHCSRHVQHCKEVLLDVITHNMGDDYHQVSECSQLRLKQLLNSVDGVKEMFETRIYEVATRLPRVMSKQDEGESLKLLKIFNGYLSSLDTQIVCLLRCHSHLHRISLALFQLLQLDCSAVNILETSTVTEYQLVSSSQLVFPVLRRQFLMFTHSTVWKEIQSSIYYFTKYGELYPLVEHFMTECQTNNNHRLQCVLILNEILHNLPVSENGITREEYDVCTCILEMYSDMYRQLLHDVAHQMNITQRNESTQLYCLILEGLVAIHQVCSSSYPELLLHSLYALLESCAHDNILIQQTALTGLDIISQSFHYSGKAELIEKHCNYVCNILSLNIRRLHRYPTSPAVLSSVIQYSQATILPYIIQIVTEVLLSLDDNYSDSALSLLRVPQTLLRQFCAWFSSSTAQENTALSSQSDSGEESHSQSEDDSIITPRLSNHLPRRSVCQSADKEGDVSAIVKEVSQYVLDYYKTRMTAKGLDPSDSEQEDVGECKADVDGEVEDLEQEEEKVDKSKKLPPHVLLTKQILDRCRHLISHSSAKVRLVVVDMVADACTVLSTCTDELLPSIHDVWSGLSKRFSDTEPLVVMKAIYCLSVLGNLSKDFIRVRVTKEVLPSLISLLHGKSTVSQRTGNAYRHTLDYKLQMMILDTVGKLCIDLMLAYPIFDRVVCSCLPYLNSTQPPQLQQKAVSCLLRMAKVDADLVWYHLDCLLSENSAADSWENAKIIIQQI